MNTFYVIHEVFNKLQFDSFSSLKSCEKFIENLKKEPKCYKNIIGPLINVYERNI